MERGCCPTEIGGGRAVVTENYMALEGTKGRELLTTKLFLPYLPIAVNMMPPFLVAMPWSAVGEFVLVISIVFLLILSAHISVLLRLQFGRVLRLGDASDLSGAHLYI